MPDLIVIPRATRYVAQALADYVTRHGNVAREAIALADYLLRMLRVDTAAKDRADAIVRLRGAARDAADWERTGWLAQQSAAADRAVNPAAVAKVIAECECASGPDSHEDDYVQNFAEQILDMLRPATATPAPDVLPEVERAPASNDSRPAALDETEKAVVMDYTTKPAGTYDAEIADVRVGTTRAGDERWSIMWVTNDTDGGRRLLAWDSLVFSTRGRARARMVFQALGAHDPRIGPKDLLGAKARVTVTVAEYAAPNGASIRRNEVTYDGVQPMPRATRKGAR